MILRKYRKPRPNPNVPAEIDERTRVQEKRIA